MIFSKHTKICLLLYLVFTNILLVIVLMHLAQFSEQSYTLTLSAAISNIDFAIFPVCAEQ